MKEKIIISCTSYGERMNNLRHVFSSILSQSVKPDAIVLNLAHGEVIPEKLQEFMETNKITALFFIVANFRYCTRKDPPVKVGPFPL